MRRLLGALLGLLLLVRPAVAFNTEQGGFSSAIGGGLPSAFGNQGAAPGPLDLVPNAAFAGGLRCLRAAYCNAGNPAVNIRRASDNAQRIVGFVGSNLNTALVSSFCAATTCYVVNLYDQSLKARNALQATTSKQPQLVLNAIGGQPAMSFVGASSQTLATASFASSTSPQTWAVVAQRTGAFTSGSGIVTAGTTGNGLLFNSAVNSVALAATGTFSASAADSSAHSIVGVNNGASSVLTVDGADTAGTDGGDVVASAALNVGSDGTHFSTSYISQAISWPSLAASPAQRAALHANDKSAYPGAFN